MINLAIFASGNGTNAQRLFEYFHSHPAIRVALVLSNKPDAFVLSRAGAASVPSVIFSKKDLREVLPVLETLKKFRIDFIVLAGFLLLIPSEIIREYDSRIINIHPALLPSFKGTEAIKDAFDYGVKSTGVTVHFVDEQMDHGPIILQETVKIKEDDTLKSLEERIHKTEHRIYPQAIKLFLEGKLKIAGRKVNIFNS